MDPRQQAAELMGRIIATHTQSLLHIDWKGEENKREAFRLARDHADYRGAMDYACDSCNLSVINALRVYIGRSPMMGAVSESMYRARINVCKGSEEQGIPRCDRLSDGFKFIPSFPFVEFKDANCTACGCFVSAKASVSFFDCPLRRWPKTA